MSFFVYLPTLTLIESKRLQNKPHFLLHLTMRKMPNKKIQKWQTEKVHYYIKEHLKTHKVKINSKEINKIWKDYIQAEIIDTLAFGGVIQLNDNAKMWVKATPITQHKVAMSLLKKGLMLNRGGVVEANINLDTSKYIYKICYENTKFVNVKQMYYAAHPNIRKAVNEGIVKGKLITRFNSN